MVRHSHRARDLLGMEADSAAVRELLVEHRLPYEVVPLSKERPTPAVVTDRGNTYSAEELVVRAQGSNFLDCVAVRAQGF